ncbi:MAG: hypothetical protein JWM59_1406 [Verrucomicrobiales bacterium]|nr:hypothetical protein [Verrucomicrobiales bacterium]
MNFRLWHRIFQASAPTVTGLALAGVMGIQPAVAAEPEAGFTENFTAAPAAPWKWIRENRDAWRVGKQGLEVRIEPGNMWGPANNGKNVLVRPVSPLAAGSLEITATVKNQPTGQYEQTDLVWYFNDSHMVKIGQEMVDGKLSVVMGREKRDQTRTMGIYPLAIALVKLRLVVRGDKISGEYQPGGEGPWLPAGTTTAPLPAAGGQPHIALMFYQGTVETPHWSQVSELKAVPRP